MIFTPPHYQTGFMILRLRVTSIKLPEFFNSFAFEAYEDLDLAAGIAVVFVTGSIDRCDDDGESDGSGAVGDDAADGDDAAAAADDAADNDAVDDDNVVNGSGAANEDVDAVPGVKTAGGNVGAGDENGDERDS